MEKKVAVFLDRDGVINRDKRNLRLIKELRLIPGAGRAIREINRLGYLVIVVTNQPVIARGLLDERGLEVIHGVLKRRLHRHKAAVHAIYYCPHHPKDGNGPYTKKCNCRKPSTGLLRAALKKYDIDSRRSFMVGDMTGDIAMGEKMKMQTILVKTGWGGTDGRHAMRPDFVARNLHAAVSIIKRHGK